MDQTDTDRRFGRTAGRTKPTVSESTLTHSLSRRALAHRLVKQKEVCGPGVVVDYSLEYALVNGEKFGIWGGLSSASDVASAGNVPRPDAAHRLDAAAYRSRHSGGNVTACSLSSIRLR